ncbi:hypothetical protein [Kineococcus arenarius]|uniref:hypothetical protein n=1 Tax=unclassified Kineococcus TaxID=2621656 RepID=UPI003D7EA3F0
MKDAEFGLPIIGVTMNRDDSTVAFLRADGKEARFPLEASPFPETSTVASLHWTPTDDSFTGPALLAITVTGDTVAFELPSSDDDEQLAGRPVVYLDQNQWSTLSKASDTSSRIPVEDRQAALRLAELAYSGALVLPASSGHYHETTKWPDDAARYQLGLTILQLSRGWQLRDPLQVRRDEIRASYEQMFFGGPAPRARSVVSLMPDVLHGPARGGPSVAAPLDFPPDFAAAYKALLSATVSIDVMLDRNHIPYTAPTGWVRVNQELSDWLDQQPLDSQQKRKSVDNALLHDLQRELAEEAQSSGIAAKQMSEWLWQHPARLPALPALGLFREVLHDRHLNRGLTWKPNDLTDMLYLSTAAAYADVVVCERTMGSALQRGLARLGRTTPVFRRLSEAVPAIERLLDARDQPVTPASP